MNKVATAELIREKKKNETCTNAKGMQNLETTHK